MNSLAAYASSSDEDQEPETSKPSPPPKKKRKLPPLPTSLAPAPNPAHSDPALHQGRVRAQPHVEGQFAAHVYVSAPVPVPAGELRLPPGWHEAGEGEGHVSLTRPVYLWAHQREEFRRAVKGVADASPRFTASFAAYATFMNDERTRAFLALEVGAGHSNLRAMADGLAPALRGLYQKEYYAQPRFHASLAWALVPRSGDNNETGSASSGLGLLASDFVGLSDERLRKCGAFEVREVCVRIGKDVRVYPLGGVE